MLKELFEEKMKKVKPKAMKMEMPESKHYPNLYLSSDDLSEIKDWEVGKKYNLILKVEQKTKSMRTTDNKKEQWNADFDILEIGVGESKIKDKYKV